MLMLPCWDQDFVKIIKYYPIVSIHDQLVNLCKEWFHCIERKDTSQNCYLNNSCTHIAMNHNLYLSVLRMLHIYHAFSN